MASNNAFSLVGAPKTVTVDAVGTGMPLTLDGWSTLEGGTLMRPQDICRKWRQRRRRPR